MKSDVRTFERFAVHFLTTGGCQSLDGDPLNVVMAPLAGLVLTNTAFTHTRYIEIIESTVV